jgi:hypothetical protein
MTITRIAQYHGEDRNALFTPFYGGTQPIVTSAAANTGSYSYRMTSTPAVGVPLGTQTAVRVSYWLYHAGAISILSSFPQLFVFGKGGNSLTGSPLLRLEWSNVAAQLILVRRLDGSDYENLAEVDLPAALLTTGQWIHLGCAYKCHETDGFFSFYINGIQVLTATGDTRLAYYADSMQQFASDFSYVYLAGSASVSAFHGLTWQTDAYIDDIYADATPNEVDEAPSSRRFLWVQPTAAGADAEWTPNTGTNHQAVDEAPMDGDVTYNKALSDGLKDTFVMGDIVIPADYRMAAAIPTAFGRKLDSGGDNTLKLHLYDQSTYDSSDEKALGMSYNAFVFERFVVQPDATAWDESSWNAMEAGYESEGIA